MVLDPCCLFHVIAFDDFSSSVFQSGVQDTSMKSLHNVTAFLRGNNCPMGQVRPKPATYW
jgi:hypothetical protein